MSENRELTLISGLCREMARLGVTVYLSDARPAAVLLAGAASVEITIDCSGSYFEWRGGRERHSAADPVGAAKRPFESLRT